MTALQSGTDVVLIAVGSFVEFPTVVTAADESQVVLAPPVVSLLHPTTASEYAVLAWSAGGDRLELHVRVLAVDDHGAWHLRPLGPPERVQRRRFFRVPLVHRCRVGADELVVDGVVVDLSEGGVRCRVPRACSPVTGSTISVDLLLGDDVVSATARVAGVSAGSDETVDLRLEITDSRVSDVLRRHVFAFQLRDRALRG